MAKPRIFISSTYYDLKHIRASLDIFVDSLGFEPVLSEKGDIAYAPDRPLDESCYREVENADIFVLIVGGRYGSEASSGSKKADKNFFDRYESITKKEYDSAVSKDVPIYILMEKGVHGEYQTFMRNKDVVGINYAHVESVNVFFLIEEIFAKQRNNPVYTFERFEEIESWLREQWAGLFRELLRRQSQQQQLASLSQQIVQLKETSETLKKYMESVMRGDDKAETTKLIESEEKRLELRKLETIKENQWVAYTSSISRMDRSAVATAIRDAKSFEDFATIVSNGSDRGKEDIQRVLLRTLRNESLARKHFNDARTVVGLPTFSMPPEWSSDDEMNTPSTDGSTKKTLKKRTVETNNSRANATKPTRNRKRTEEKK